MTSPTTDTRIRDLNDAMRRAGPSSGCWIMTRGVTDEGVCFMGRAVAAVQAFDVFTEDNDPYGEHDFGAFDLGGQRVFWKIDYYDRGMEHGSEDPADPDATVRVLTILLASEY